MAAGKLRDGEEGWGSQNSFWKHVPV
jgi:hypothetical protein